MPTKQKTVIKNLKTKDLLRKVFNFFDMESRNGRPWDLKNPIKRLAKATGLSETTIHNATKEDDPVQDVVKSIHEDFVRKSKSDAMKLDDFDEGLVRRTIHGMYEKKEFVTMSKLHAAMKEKDIDVSLSTIVRTVKKLGFRCRIPGLVESYNSNYTAEYNVTQCTYMYNSTVQTCSSWVYDQSVYTDTLISTFDTVCDRKFYRSHLVMAQHIGSFVGSFVGSLCADILGRKPVFCIGGFLLFTSNIILPWVKSFVLVAFLRAVNGFSGTFVYIAAFILATEIVVPSKRFLVAFVVSGFYTLGLYIMDLMAYFLRDWHDLVLYTSIPIGVCLFYWFILPESPRWLIVKGKSKQAAVILHKMAKVNKSEIFIEEEDTFVCDDMAGTSFFVSLKTVLSSKILLLQISILAFNWAAVTLIYYGISMNVGKLGGNVYINFLIATTVGIVGEILSVVTSTKIGRRKQHMSFMIIGGVACLSTIFTAVYGDKSLHGLTIALAMVGKLAINAAFILIYLYTTELAPTVLRGFFLSICSCFGRIGSISSSYVGDLGLLLETKFGRALPLIIFGIVGTVAGLLCLLLPETKDKALPETAYDAEKMARSEIEENIKETEDFSAPNDALSETVPDLYDAKSRTIPNSSINSVL